MKKLRYFIDFINGQQNWLNKMAEKGYRLCGTSRVGYEFKECLPGAYTYIVQYVAEKSPKELREYRQYLEDLGYVHYAKNTSIQFGYKAKLRYNGKRLQLATNPGLLNKELLIIEVPKGEELELFTTAKENHSYYAILRNIFLLAAVLMIGLTMFGRTKVEVFGHILINEQILALQIVMGILVIPILLIALQMIRSTAHWKREMRIRE